MRRILVVTPAFNSETYLAETLRSVIHQAAPNLRLHYHVQDGGSSDDTLQILEMMSERLKSERHLAAFSYASASDRGMYEAINRGFDALAPGDQDILTWINSDDLLAPGALATVLQVLSDVPDCAFLSGRVALMNSAGAVTTVASPTAYARLNLAAGLHDGRRLPFVMQEGTFFTGALWKAVGGVDPTLRLAGDWDLWRRMAARADHHTVDSVIGLHRRHPGQLTSSLIPYHVEVDARLAAQDGPADVVDPTSYLIRHVGERQRWVRIPFNTSEPPPPTRLRGTAIEAGLGLRYEEGFAPPEGPYPEYALPGGVRWLVAPQAVLSVRASFAGRYRCRLRLRSGVHNLRLSLGVNGRGIFAAHVPDPRPMKDEIVESVCWLNEGWNALKVTARADASRARRMLLVDVEILEEPPTVPPRVRPSPAHGETCLRVEVDATNVAAAALADTLESLGELPADWDRRVVGAASDDLSACVLAVFASQIDAVFKGYSAQTLSSVDDGPDPKFVLRLRAGDRLSPGAAMRLLEAASSSGSDVAQGLVDLAVPGGRLIARQIPDAEASPLMMRTAPSSSCGASRLLVGETLATRMEELRRVVPDAGLRPRLWLVEQEAEPDAPDLGSLAAAFALLDVDVRHLQVPAGSAAGWAHLPFRDEAVICSGSPPPGARAFATASKGEEGFLRLTSSSGEIALPPAIDASVFGSHAQWLARSQLGVDDDTFVVVLDGAMALEPAPRNDALGTGPPPFLWLKAAAGDPSDLQGGVQAMILPRDARFRALWLGAADVLVRAPDLPLTALMLEAAASGLPVVLAVEVEGPALRLEERRRGRGARRPPLDASASIEALALALVAQAKTFDWAANLAQWLGARRTLLPSPAPLRTGRAPKPSLLEPPFSEPITSGSRLLCVSGCSAAAQADWPYALNLASPLALLLLETPSSLMGLRLAFAAKEAGSWTVRLGTAGLADLVATEPGRSDVVIRTTLPAGHHRLEVASLDEVHGTGLDLLTWEVLGHPDSAGSGGLRTGATRPVPLSGRRRDVFDSDGDWRFVRGFFAPEAAHPELGLHDAFRWSRGGRAYLRVRIEWPGQRWIRLAVTGVLRGQRVRLALQGSATAWSAPMDGLIGRMSLPSWLMTFPQGDLDLVLETSSSLGRRGPRDLGVIVTALELSPPTSDVPKLEATSN